MLKSVLVFLKGEINIPVRLIYALLLIAMGGSAFANTVVETNSGMVGGTVTATALRFVGIPYAKPPIDALRWRAPQPLEPWGGTFNASQFGFKCMQSGKLEEMSEDCLTLNVFTPKSVKANAKLPVVFWIHGGGFVAGGGENPHMNPDWWTNKGLIFVTFNYRLGALGFFEHPLLNSQEGDNFGLSDMVAALTWVNSNIAKFGGDVNNITIAGQSAGGMAVNLLMVTSKSKGLFQHAIAQSGYGTWPLLSTARQADSDAQENASGFFSHLVSKATEGQKPPENEAELRAIPASELVAAHKGFITPIIDYVTLQSDVGQLFAQGKQHKVPYLSGGNSFDGAVFPYSNIPENTILQMVSSKRDVINDIYAKEFTHSEQLAVETLFGDMRYLHSAGYLTKQLALQGLPAYAYYFAYAPKGMPGAPHGYEMSMLFNPDSEQGIELSRYWLNFIRTGNPNQAGTNNWAGQNTDGNSWKFFPDKAANELPNIKQKMQVFDELYKQRQDL